MKKIALIISFLLLLFAGRSQNTQEQVIIITYNGEEIPVKIDMQTTNSADTTYFFEVNSDNLLKTNEIWVGEDTKTPIAEVDDDSYDFNEEEMSIHKSMLALKEQYPEGMRWTNDNYYEWKGGIYTGGYGCAAFSYMLSDAAFKNLPARMHSDFNNLRVGDILRINNDTHYVIIIGLNDSGVILAEGNFNSSVHWGRKISFERIKAIGNYILTRYPE